MDAYFKQLDFQPAMLGRQISNVLTQAIVANEIKGGEQLVELKLQKELGVSRSPLREAFRDLEKLGLVEIQPNKGTFVRTIGKKDVRDNYEVRAPLEGLAAKKAYPRMTEADHRALAAVLADMNESALAGRVIDYWRRHAVFHEIFIKASGNRVLIDTLATLRVHSVRHRMAFPNYDEDLIASNQIHRKIYDLFVAPDTDEKGLERTVIQHIDDVLDHFLANISET